MHVLDNTLCLEFSLNLDILHTLAGVLNILFVIGERCRLAEAADGNGWKFRSCHGQRIQGILDCIRLLPFPKPNTGTDIPLWKISSDKYDNIFSSRL